MSEKHFQNFYYIIPSLLIEDTKNPWIGILYGLITSLTHKNGYCYATNKFLAEKMGKKIRSIQNYLEILKEKKWIKIEINKALGNVRKIYLNAGLPLMQDTAPLMQDTAPPSASDCTTPSASECTHSIIKNSNILSNKESKPKKERKAADKSALASSDAHVLTLLMIDKIKIKDKKFKVPNILSWDKEFDKILKIDKRSKEEIINTIEKVYEDDFWKANILSPKKLREKFTSLTIKFSDEKKYRNGSVHFKSNYEEECKKFGLKYVIG